MSQSLSDLILKQVRAELESLDTTLVEVDGKHLRPSQCYRFETDPAHVMFNTNCPESLKAQVEAILAKYTGNNESNP